MSNASNHTSFSIIDEAEASEFICAVCTDLWQDPIELEQCGHVFCKACLAQVRNGKCPECRGPTSRQRAPNRKLMNLCEEVKVRCERCKWQGTRSASRSHDEAACRRHRENLEAEAILDRACASPASIERGSSLRSSSLVASKIADNGAPPRPQWSCSKCTLDNDAAHQQCAACDAPRDAAVMAQSVASVASRSTSSASSPLLPATTQRATTTRTSTGGESRPVTDQHEVVQQMFQGYFPPSCPGCKLQLGLPPKKWNCPRCLIIKMWQPNEDGSCVICRKSVGAFTRHHCRVCGYLMCGGCSAYNPEKERVCVRCKEETCP